MKLTLLFLTISMLSFSAAASAQRVSITANNMKMEKVLDEITQQTGLTVAYSKQVVDLNRLITIDVKDAEVRNVLNKITEGTNMTYEIKNDKIYLSRRTIESVSIPQQKGRRITGVVTDIKGEPIVGANVLEKGTTNGIITDADGKFSLEIASASTLQVSYIGYLTQDLAVGNKSDFLIKLLEDTQKLDEVVVVGYGTSRKRDIVSAISSVKSGTISAASTSNIQDILQGKVAGLDIQSARYAGDNQQIFIRGARSLNAGNSPLVVVDGIPGSLGSVNTYDIESIEVLKDAASAAIYGSMGANGVVLVTTKRGKKGVKREVNFNSYLGVNVPHMMELESGEQFAQFRRDAYRYAYGWNKPFTDENVFASSELDVIKSGNYTDWMNLLYRNALIQSYYLGISNSDAKTRLMLSFKYDKEEGYYKTNASDNYNFSLTADHDLADFWTIGSTIRLKRNNISGFEAHGDEILYMNPLCKAYTDDGELNYFPNPKNTSGYNPLANYVPGQFQDDTQNNILNLNLTSLIKINKHISVNTNFGYIFSDYKRGYFYGKNSYKGKGVKTSSGKNYNNADQWTVNNIISYDNSFGDHNVAIDLVGELQSRKYDSGTMSGENQPVEYTSYHNLSSNTENVQIASTYENWALASVLGRLRYNYKHKYYFNFAFRTDGSSRLASGNKWASFPSGGISWSLKDEDFMQKMNWVTSLKLRLSYGSVGNTAISPYQTLSTLSQYAYLFGEDAANKFYVYNPSSLANHDLGWEISKTINAGLDFGLFDNKLNGYFEYYITKTSDLLMQRTIPSFTGFSNIWQNIGKTQTKGVEFNLNYNPIKSRDLNVDISLNASRNWEKIIDLISGEDLPNNNWFIGKPLGVFYGYKKIGVWQIGEETEAAKYNAVPGDIKIKDQNGDGTISAADDKIILGQVRPKWIASLGTTIRYKDFDFSFNLNSRWGYLIHPSPYENVILDGLRWLPDVNYWTPDNPTNDYPKADAARGYDTYMSSCGYMKGDHIKLQDITFGYNLKNIVSNLVPFKQLRFYVQLRNVCYLYRAAKYDVIPEQPSINYTVPSSYNFGVNITF